jgi:hypothetical protein
MTQEKFQSFCAELAALYAPSMTHCIVCAANVRAVTRKILAAAPGEKVDITTADYEAELAALRAIYPPGSYRERKCGA